MLNIEEFEEFLFGEFVGEIISIPQGCVNSSIWYGASIMEVGVQFILAYRIYHPDYHKTEHTGMIE